MWNLLNDSELNATFSASAAEHHLLSAFGPGLDTSAASTQETGKKAQSGPSALVRALTPLILISLFLLLNLNFKLIFFNIVRWLASALLLLLYCLKLLRIVDFSNTILCSFRLITNTNVLLLSTIN